MIAIIAAMDRNRVIGHQGGIPWYLPDDWKQVKEKTEGKVIIMGRKTFESIGKPLPQRTSIVVTSHDMPLHPDIIQARTVDEALSIASSHGRDIFFFGGENIYREGLYHADVVYLSVVDGSYQGDTFFPPLDTSWVIKAEEPREGFTLYTYHKQP